MAGWGSGRSFADIVKSEPATPVSNRRNSLPAPKKPSNGFDLDTKPWSLFANAARDAEIVDRAVYTYFREKRWYGLIKGDHVEFGNASGVPHRLKNGWLKHHGLEKVNFEGYWYAVVPLENRSQKTKDAGARRMLFEFCEYDDTSGMITNLFYSPGHYGAKASKGDAWYLVEGHPYFFIAAGTTVSTQ